jgi:queuine tRNA-ribosyltransferase
MPALTTAHGPLATPAFVPDATRAVVRGVPAPALARHGVECVLVSTAHLANQPGATVVRQAGGIHAFMGWGGPVVSDSGGFQVFSLLNGPTGLASVSDGGLRYRFSPKAKYRDLTPRSCIETQLRLGADVCYALDFCTHPEAPRAEQERSVDLTLRWAAECRATFDRALDRAGPVGDGTDRPRPVLFGVVQGGRHRDLRARCAEGLVALGFDGYGFGGYPIVGGRLVEEVGLVAELLPPGSVLHGLGIGTPANLVASWRAGYTLFDCTLPTRNGRRGVLYTGLDPALPEGGPLHRHANMLDERWIRARGPVDDDCDCEACTSVPASYLAHLYRTEDALAGTLGSLHNLRFYTRLTAALRARVPARAPSEAR